ncbi:hypothetical protein ACQUW5_07790, partial [Legionella sp. CNM-1927-20]|uniref:hypothetical protein n=1 Tax=Legionella sp. CNM-1927-20 TaxID=3422221 RepID=UPI00403AC1AF
MIDKIWVYAGTGIRYDGTVDIQALTNITQKNGLTVKGDLNGIPLEYITRTAWQKRERVWI